MLRFYYNVDYKIRKLRKFRNVCLSCIVVQAWLQFKLCVGIKAILSQILLPWHKTKIKCSVFLCFPHENLLFKIHAYFFALKYLFEIRRISLDCNNKSKLKFDYRSRVFTLLTSSPYAHCCEHTNSRLSFSF